MHAEHRLKLSLVADAYAFARAEPQQKEEATRNHHANPDGGLRDANQHTDADAYAHARNEEKMYYSDAYARTAFEMAECETHRNSDERAPSAALLPLIKGGR